MKVFFLVHETARKRCADYAIAAPDGWMVRFSEPKRKDIQSDKFHAMIGDIAKQCRFMEKKLDADDWKRLLVDAFAKVMRDAQTPIHHDGRVLPSLDFTRVVQLGIQTSEFYVKEAAQFIEYLYSYGAEHDVIWTEPKVQDF